jgi:hypothetical protein
MATVGEWTPYAELNSVLSQLLSGAQAVLGDNFVGMYLHGSLAAGDFNPQASDVDFAVVTNHVVTAEQQRGLEQLAQQLFALVSEWPGRLEGSFLSATAFASGACQEHFSIRTGRRSGYDAQEIEGPLQRHMLRTKGIVLAGPGPTEFIAPVTAAELRAASARLLHNWWAPQIKDQHRLHKRPYQIYAILTMCRIAFSLAHGQLASKPEAARWAMEHDLANFRAPIARAMQRNIKDGVDDREAVVNLISATLELADSYP